MLGSASESAAAHALHRCLENCLLVAACTACAWHEDTLLLHITGSVGRCAADANVLTGRCTGDCASRCDSSFQAIVSMHECTVAGSCSPKSFKRCFCAHRAARAGCRSADAVTWALSVLLCCDPAGNAALVVAQPVWQRLPRLVVWRGCCNRIGHRRCHLRPSVSPLRLRGRLAVPDGTPLSVLPGRNSSLHSPAATKRSSSTASASAYPAKMQHSVHARCTTFLDAVQYGYRMQCGMTTHWLGNSCDRINAFQVRFTGVA